MNRFFKKKMYAIAAVLILAVTLALPVDALASPVILGLSTNDIKVGDTFTVSLSGAESSNLSLHYDGTMVTLKDQKGATLDGNTLTIPAKSVSFTFTAKQEGNAGFVASSDKFERSSAVVKIAAGAASDTSDDTQTAAAATDENSDAGTDNDADTASASQSSVSDSSAEVSSSSDTAEQVSDDDETDISKHGISSSDLSFKQLILDRRMILVIAVLLAVIIILIIRITTLHYALTGTDYDDDDIDFDENEKNIAEKEEEEKNRLVEHVTDRNNESQQPKTPYDPDFEIDEEKLTMPKAPKRPNEKLKLEDLNNL